MLFTTAVIRSPPTKYASDAENTNFPDVMSTYPPPKFTAYSPRFTDRRISSGACPLAIPSPRHPQRMHRP